MQRQNAQNFQLRQYSDYKLQHIYKSICPPSTVYDYQSLLLTTNKACVSQILILGILLAPEVGKGVNNDTKDEVEDDDVDQEEEHEIVQNTAKEIGILWVGGAE